VVGETLEATELLLTTGGKDMGLVRMVKRGNRYDFGAVRFSRQWDGDVFGWKRKNQFGDRW